jgi:uncharacterized protein YrzB (UPF0473 family)
MIIGDTFIACTENGEEIECEVIFTHTDENTGKTYVVYSDNVEDGLGNVGIYTGICVEEDGEEGVYPIQTEEELMMIEDILVELLSGDE